MMLSSIAGTPAAGIVSGFGAPAGVSSAGLDPTAALALWIAIAGCLLVAAAAMILALPDHTAAPGVAICLEGRRRLKPYAWRQSHGRRVESFGPAHPRQPVAMAVGLSA